MASWSIRRKPVRRRTGQPAWAHAGEQQPAFFGPAPAIQPKLAIGTPGDAYEREADAVAERVVSGGTASPALSTSTGLGAPMQRMCPECEQEQKVQRMAEEEEPVQAQAEEEEMVQSQAEEEEPVQAQAEEEEMVQSQAEGEEPVQAQAEEEEMVQGKAQGSAPQHFASRLQARQGSGQPLPAPVRAQMEGGIGADFSGVRIHTDGEAQQMSQSIRAHAFTRGRDIYFNAGQYQPQSSAGQRLLAHELTHVVQQGAGEIVRRTMGDGHDLSAPRFRGHQRMEEAFDNESFIRQGDRGYFVQKIQEALIEAGHALPRFGADGIFGPETAAAVQAFQRSQGLAADAIIGPLTMGAFNNAFQQASPSQGACCSDALAAGLDNGDLGGVVCCNNVMTRCFWEQNTVETNATARRIVQDSVLEHEANHLDDIACTGAALERPGFNAQSNQNAEECASHRTERQELLNRIGTCGADATCRTEVQNRIDFMNQRIAALC